MVKIEFEISDESYELLKKINEEGYAEYRDRAETVEEFMESDFYKNGSRGVYWFLSRNFGGTRKLAYELLGHQLIVDMEGSWHTTFVISNFGKNIITKEQERERTINKIINNE